MSRAGWDTGEIPDLEGRLAVVTGATSGHGFQTTTALALVGAAVVLATRDAAGGHAAETIRRSAPRAVVTRDALER